MNSIEEFIPAIFVIIVFGLEVMFDSNLSGYE